jgi:hypothetical protein
MSSVDNVAQKPYTEEDGPAKSMRGVAGVGRIAGSSSMLMFNQAQGWEANDLICFLMCIKKAVEFGDVFGVVK